MFYHFAFAEQLNKVNKITDYEKCIQPVCSSRINLRGGFLSKKIKKN